MDFKSPNFVKVYEIMVILLNFLSEIFHDIYDLINGYLGTKSDDKLSETETKIEESEKSTDEIEKSNDEIEDKTITNETTTEKDKEKSEIIAEEPTITEKFQILDSLVGQVIGKKGLMIKKLQKIHGTTISLDREPYADESNNTFFKIAYITGSPQKVNDTIEAIEKVIKERTPEKTPETPVEPEKLWSKIPRRQSQEGGNTRRPRTPQNQNNDSTPRPTDVKEQSVIKEPKLNLALEAQSYGNWRHPNQLNVPPLKRPSIWADPTSKPEVWNKNEKERYLSMLKIMIEGHLHSKSTEAFIEEFTEKVPVKYRQNAVFEMLMIGLERGEIWRSFITDLLIDMLDSKAKKIISPNNFKHAVFMYLSKYATNSADFPHIAIFTSEYFTKILDRKFLTFRDIRIYFGTGTKQGYAEKYLAEQLKMLVEVYGIDRTREIWQNSKMALTDFLSDSGKLDDFVKSNGLEYLQKKDENTSHN